MAMTLRLGCDCHTLFSMLHVRNSVITCTFVDPTRNTAGDDTVLTQSANVEGSNC